MSLYRAGIFRHCRGYELEWSAATRRGIIIVRAENTMGRAIEPPRRSIKPEMVQGFS
jgi:hypothetical protein